MRNINASAFRLHPRNLSKADGKSILLIDDVLSTGVTTVACTRVLKAGGPSSIDVLTLARVVQDASDTISAQGYDDGEGLEHAK